MAQKSLDTCEILNKTMNINFKKPHLSSKLKLVKEKKVSFYNENKIIM